MPNSALSKPSFVAVNSQQFQRSLSTLPPRSHHAGPARCAPRASAQTRRHSVSRSHKTAAHSRTSHCAVRAPRPSALRRRRQQRRPHQTSRTNDDERRRKDAACPHGHKAEDADRWGTRKLGCRPGNGAPLRARVPSFFLPCERGLNSHTVVITRPRLSLAL